MTDYPAFRVLHWLSTVTSDHQHPPAEVCPVEDQKDVYDELAHAGLVEETETLDGSFSFILSAAGRDAARRVRREYRPELARRCVLAFLDNAGGPAQRPGLEDSHWADDHTGALTEQEINEAADDLEDLRLISGTRTIDDEFYIFKITSAGRRALRGPAPIGGGDNMSASTSHTTTTTTVTGNHNQIAAGTNGTIHQAMSRDTTTTTTYENIGDIVRVLLEQLPQLPLNQVDMADIRDDAEVVLAEIVTEEPNRTVMRRALNSLRGLLSPIVLGVNQAVSAEANEIARHTIEQITGSGLV